jgi:hypothetical protein
MSKLSIIQILRLDNIKNYQEIIVANAKFLHDINKSGLMNVEYLVYDNLKSDVVLKFIKTTTSVKYFRKDFLNSKTSFLESGLMALGDRIIYLKSEDKLTMENVEYLEKVRPNILKQDLRKIANLKNPNFKYDNFNLLVKENKTLWEKIKLLFISN